MSFSASAAARGSGPMNVLLSSPAAQWATLGGLGAYLVSPEAVQATIQRTLQSMAANSNGLNDFASQSDSRSVPSSIVIHTGHSNGSKSGSGIVTTLITYTIAAGCVWVTYTVLSHALPDYVSNLLPVTRHVFDQTSKNLATSICNLKDIVALQIQKIMKKQDTLGRKQDDMHRDVQSMQDDVSLVRTDLLSILESVERCDATVEASQELQSYTARGVKLLVSAVGSVLPAENHVLLRELEHYARDGDAFRRSLERSNSKQGESYALAQTQSMALTSARPCEPPEQDHPQSSRYAPHYREPSKPHVRGNQYGSSLHHVTPNPTQGFADRGDDYLSRIRAGELLVPHH